MTKGIESINLKNCCLEIYLRPIVVPPKKLTVLAKSSSEAFRALAAVPAVDADAAVLAATLAPRRRVARDDVDVDVKVRDVIARNVVGVVR